MYTRCPACEALFELSPEELAEAAGVVRCSNCGKTFNSLASLFDRQPETDELPLKGKGMPPLLAHRVVLQPPLPGLDNGAVAEITEVVAPEPPATIALPVSSGLSGAGRWRLVSALLAGLAMIQAIWLFELPQRLFEPAASSASNRQGAEAVVLMARDMHAHPTLEDAVIISASLRNQAPVMIDFPIIELRLFDRSNQVLGALRLGPEDYLDNPARAPSGFAPGALLPLIVEIAVTGSEPTGFELRFF